MNRNIEIGKFATMPLNYGFDNTVPPRYEKGDNGIVDYVYTIDVNSFSPSDIRLEQRGNMLIIEAKKSRSGTKQSVHGNSEESEYKEFKKEISLPNNIDMKKDLRSIYKDNGQLEIRIPTLPQSYATLYPPVRRPISIQKQSVPSSHVQFQSTSSQSSPSSPTNTLLGQQRAQTNSLSQFDTGFPRSPVRCVDRAGYYVEEVIIDPLFRPEDLIVRTKGARVVISARREELGRNGYSNTREFSDEHDLPANVDLDGVKATLLTNGTLLIEAPYKSAPSVPIPITVHRG